jgi:hypothetical protein
MGCPGVGFLQRTKKALRGSAQWTALMWGCCNVRRRRDRCMCDGRPDGCMCDGRPDRCMCDGLPWRGVPAAYEEGLEGLCTMDCPDVGLLQRAKEA